MKTFAVIIFCLLVFSTLQAQLTTDIVNMSSANQSFITIQGFSINSIGEFKEAWDKGSGGILGYGTIYPDRWALMMQIGYISFQHNEDIDYSGDPSFTIVPLAIGGRYYFVTDRFRPFLLAMSGINIVSQNYTRGDETVDKTTAQLHFQVGIGLGIRIISRLEIEGQAKYNSHVLEPSLPYNITGMEYGIALNWHL
jgi:hypothetical protein